MENFLGQTSWRFEDDACRGWVTRLGGMTGPVEFKAGDRWISPFHVAPWAEEAPNDDTPPMLQALRGDFLCMPFGSNDTPYRGEQHPPHGETANRGWEFASQSGTELQLQLRTEIRPGTVRKTIRTVPGHSVLYVRHHFEGYEGPMALGHHAMLRFRSPGWIATSPFLEGRTHPGDFEGKTSLPNGRRFDRLEDLDLVRFPAREGHEDLVQLRSDPNLSFTWTAVTFPEEGFVWFSLKNPRQLRSTIFWFSNAGRDHAPWSGRHRAVVGLEEVTAKFNLGLAESVEAGETLELSDLSSLSVLMGIAPVPTDFGEVGEIWSEGDTLRIRDKRGHEVIVPYDSHWLSGSG
ncbi:hypothetical protein BH11ARM2_BH11ARM2_20400 [soil metagenome]